MIFNAFPYILKKAFDKSYIYVNVVLTRFSKELKMAEKAYVTEKSMRKQKQLKRDEKREERKRSEEAKKVAKSFKQLHEKTKVYEPLKIDRQSTIEYIMTPVGEPVF